MKKTFEVKILKKNGDEYPMSKNNRVSIPFGDEYRVSVKNLTGDRRMFTIYIDGEPTNENKFILYGNDTEVIERWGGTEDNDEARKFVWLQPEHKDVEHKKDNPEAGMIRVKMWTEEADSWNYYTPPIIIRERIIERERPRGPFWPYWYSPTYYTTWDTTDVPDFQITCGGSGGGLSSGASMTSSQCFAASSSEPEGMTGEGGYSGQHFQSVSGFNVSSETEEQIFFLVRPENYKEAYTTKVERVDEHVANYCCDCGAKRKNPKWITCPFCDTKY